MNALWKVSLPDETLVIDEYNNDIAKVLGDYETDYERMAARAQMIAAAPTMRALLADWIGFLEGDVSENKYTASKRAARNLLNLLDGK